MTTIIPFLPSNIQTPSFKATLDTTDCTVKITWNVSAKRYYINVYDSNGIWIITTALVSSPPGRSVQSIIYDPFLSSMLVQFVDPSLWPIPASGPITLAGTMVDYTLEGFQPATYNGKFRCMHLDGLNFIFPMPQDPGPCVIQGKISRLLNMVATVFNTSTMVYRNGCFEINP